MNEKLSRRELLQAAFAIPAAAALAGCPSGAAGKTGPGPLADLDATATAEAIARGELSVREAVEAAIRRAEAVEPRINAVVTEAYDRARASAAGAFSGPFAGVPTFVKDLDDVRGLPTHSGSRSFGLEPATGQGPYVDALERSGSSSSARAARLSSDSRPRRSRCCTARHATREPRARPGRLVRRYRALVAAHVVPIAHATDRGGSIRVPPACSGVSAQALAPAARSHSAPPHRPGRHRRGHYRPSPSVTRALASVTERTGGDKVYPADGMMAGRPHGGSRRPRSRDHDGLARGPQVRTALEDTARRCEALGHRVEVAPLPLAKREFAEAFILCWSSSAARIADGLAKQLGRPVTDAVSSPGRSTARLFPAAARRLQRGHGHAAGVLGHRRHVLRGARRAAHPGAREAATADRRAGTGPAVRRALRERLGYLGFAPVQNGSGTPGVSMPLHWSQAGLPIGSHFAARAGDGRHAARAGLRTRGGLSLGGQAARARRHLRGRRARRVVGNQRGEALEQLRREIVAKPVDRHQAAVRDLHGRVHAAGDGHQRVGTPVDDQGRAGDAAQLRAAIAVRDDRDQLAHDPGRVVAAQHGLADARMHLLGRGGIARAADDGEGAHEVARHGLHVPGIRRPVQQLALHLALRLRQVACAGRGHDGGERLSMLHGRRRHAITPARVR